MKKRQVLFSSTAKSKLENILLYLEENWPDKTRLSFLKKLDKSIELIQSFPDLFPLSHKRYGVHKAVITKQITLFYRLDDFQIEIITLFDTRQDPDKLSDDIKQTGP